MAKKTVIRRIREAEARAKVLNELLERKTGLTENEGLLLIHLRDLGWTNHVELADSNTGWGYVRSGNAVNGLKRKGLIEYVRHEGIRFRINAEGRAWIPKFKKEL